MAVCLMTGGRRVTGCNKRTALEGKSEVLHDCIPTLLHVVVRQEGFVQYTLPMAIQPTHHQSRDTCIAPAFCTEWARDASNVVDSKYWRYP